MTVLPDSAVSGRHADPEAAADLDLAVRVFLQGPAERPQLEPHPAVSDEAVQRLVDRLLHNGPDHVLAIRWAVLRYERCPTLASRIDVIDTVIEAGLPPNLSRATEHSVMVPEQEQL